MKLGRGSYGARRSRVLSMGSGQRRWEKKKTDLFKSQTSNQLYLALNAHRCTSSQRPLSDLRTSALAAVLQGERETLATTQQRFRMGTGCTSPGIRERERGSPGFRLTGDQAAASQRMHSDVPCDALTDSMTLPQKPSD